MYQNYDRAVSKVFVYLTDNNYGRSAYFGHKKCFRVLKMYLTEQKLVYSREIAVRWLESMPKDSKPNLTVFRVHRLALSRLNDVFEGHEIINTKEIKESHQNYAHLNSDNKTLVDTFLKETSMTHGFKASYLHKKIRMIVARFLIYLSSCGIDIPTEITHKSLCEYYRNDIHRTVESKNLYTSLARFFLEYLANKKLINSSLPLALNRFVVNRLVFVNELPEKEQILFHENSSTGLFSAEEFHMTSMQLENNCLEKHSYCYGARVSFQRVWMELFVFLEANEFDYSPELALCWANYMQRYTGNWKTYRRAVKLFEQFRNDGDIQPGIVYFYGKNRVEELPEWCKVAYRDFIADRQKRELALSTIKDFRYPCQRFLEYLTGIGITAWRDVTPEIIKRFHLADLHSTPAGKHGYVFVVKAFLEYLGSKKIVPPYLYLTLSAECAPRVDIIKTLDGEKLAAIYEFKNNAQTGLHLRIAAMAMLGIRMGIRASDVVGLKLSDISWDDETISILQKKTNKFIKLPMPTEVGNSLYKYIMSGRPSTHSEYVFVKHKTPYDKLTNGSCSFVLKQILPHDPCGFHTARKTFASRMLVNNTKPGIIAEALGHRSNSTVMTYLATDVDTTRKCAISLSEIEVKEGILS